MDMDRARERLEQERERLEQVRRSFQPGDQEGEVGVEAPDELSAVDQHPADLGTDTFERQKDLSILESVEAELVEVERAERRIEEGTYGVCEGCGKPIGAARLEARPAARLCVEDQARAEREARAP